MGNNTSSVRPAGSAAVADDEDGFLPDEVPSILLDTGDPREHRERLSRLLRGELQQRQTRLREEELQAQFDGQIGHVMDMDMSTINHGSATVPRPCLRYHTIKGQNVTLSQNNSIASRNPGVFCKGLVFSDRPIELDEIVCIKLAKVAETWSGMFRVGLTNVDPACFRDIELPKYACPNLTYRPGYWAKSVPDRYCVQNAIIHFFINETGVLFFGTNGIFRGMFMSEIDTSKPLWLMIDIYGNTESIEILERADPATVALADRVEMEQPEYRPIRPIVSNDIPPYIFHFLVGANACRLGSWTVRRQQGRNQGYCFLQRSLRVGEQLAIRVNEVDNTLLGCIAFGLTSCNPNDLHEEDLPVNFDDFVERPEYWVGIQDVVAYPEIDDILQFTITETGAVTCSKNGLYARTIMHVDTSIPLWPFFDLNGATKGIQLIPPLPHRVRESEDLPISLNFGNDQPSTSREARQTSPEAYSRLQNNRRVNYEEDSDNEDVLQSPIRRLRGIAMIDSDDESPSPRYTRDSHPVRDTTDSVLSNFRSHLLRDMPNLLRPDYNSEEPTSAQRTRRQQYLFDSDDEDVIGWRSGSDRPSAASAGIVRTTMEHVRRHREVTPEEVAESEPSTPPPTTYSTRRRRSLSQPNTPLLEPIPDTSRVSRHMRALLLDDEEPAPPTERYAATAPPPSTRVNSTPVEPTPTATSEADNEDDEASPNSNTECCICWSTRANAAIYRCGHVCMCVECARQLSTTSGTCPMCRQRILDIVQLYFS
uniref:NEUR n=1 Tax=Panagrellus redivivus TaxID=6233 RepID=A0A7E4UMK5_PANRE